MHGGVWLWGIRVCHIPGVWDKISLCLGSYMILRALYMGVWGDMKCCAVWDYVRYSGHPIFVFVTKSMSLGP